MDRRRPRLSRPLSGCSTPLQDDVGTPTPIVDERYTATDEGDGQEERDSDANDEHTEKENDTDDHNDEDE